MDLISAMGRVEVRIVPDDILLATTTTDSAGRFEVAVSADEQYSVTASRAGFAWQRLRAQL